MRAKKKAPQRFAIYLRCSTDDQRFGDFTTIDTQRELNKERIAELGGELVAEYADEGKTGSNLNRAAWRKMLADADIRKFDAVVVTYMSRLARGEAYHVAEYLLKEEKVTVELVKEKFSPDMVGQLHKGLQIVMDGNYCRQVSEWTRTKQESMVAHGYHTGGVPAYGFRSETVPGMAPVMMGGGKVKPPPKRLVPDENAAPIVRHCFDIYLQSGNMGQVLRFLRDAEPGRSWTIDTVRRILTNEKYIGVARFGEKVNLQAHEALVTHETFQAAQEKLAKPTKPEEAPEVLGYVKEQRVDPIGYYLRGKVRCGHCDCLMTPAGHYGSSGKVGYYQCPRACKHGAECTVKRVNAHTLHEVVVAEIARCAKHPTRLNTLIREAAKRLPETDDLSAELARHKRNRRETDKKIARLVAAIRDGGSSAALNKEVRQLEALGAEQDTKIAEGQARLGSLSAPRPDSAALAALWGDFSCRWQQLSLEERTLLLGCLVDSVTMLEKEKGALRLRLCLPETSQDSICIVGFEAHLGAGEGLEPPTFGL